MKNLFKELFKLKVTFDGVGICTVYLFLATSLFSAVILASIQVLPEQTINLVKNTIFNQKNQLVPDSISMEIKNNESHECELNYQQIDNQFKVLEPPYIPKPIIESDDDNHPQTYRNTSIKCCKGDENLKAGLSSLKGLGTLSKNNTYPDVNPSSSLGRGNSLEEIRKAFEQRQLNPDDCLTDKNILLALYWLADHQIKNKGNWSADNFIEQCKTNSPSLYPVSNRIKFGRDDVCRNLNENSDKGTESYTNVVTGLATLAFLGAGFTHQEGQFMLPIRRALRYILSIQCDNGCFGSSKEESIMYSHILCTQAIIEDYILTEVAKLKAPAHLGVDFIVGAQNIDSDLGWTGWGFMPQDGKPNTFMTEQAIFTLYCARKTGFKVPDRCFEGAEKFLNSVTSHPTLDKTTDKYPRTSFETLFSRTNKYEKLPTMDAMNISCRRLLGYKSNDSILMWQSELIAFSENGNLPTTENPEKIDFLYWNFASLAMFQMGDNYWNLWKKPAYDSIIKLQRLEDKNACAYGSWDPIDTWGSVGGRVFATAINALTLETEYRYNRLSD